MAVQWYVQSQGGGWQLSVRVSGEAAMASLVVRVWAVSRDEPALLREVIEAK